MTDDSSNGFTINRNLLRGAGWLAIALLGLWSIDHLAWTGLSEYSVRKLGGMFTAATAAFGGYRISRDVLRIDPGTTDNPVGYALLQLARALLVGLLAVAVCASV